MADQSHPAMGKAGQGDLALKGQMQESMPHPMVGCAGDETVVQTPPSVAGTTVGGAGGAVTLQEGEKQPMDDVLKDGAKVNVERGLVVHSGSAQDAMGDAEEEFVFDEEELAAETQNRWMAVALYYSGQAYNTKSLFTELSDIWGAKEAVKARLIRENQFLVEFGSEQTMNFVLNGGPWKHKGDALILVKYDGFTKLSDVIITSIPLWVRIYDIPVSMITVSFIRALGSKIGRVIEVGQAIKNYKRVKIDFALADPLSKTVQIKVRGCGMLEFQVKYEAVPYFCFTCGRIGHKDRECPEEEAEEGVKFGKELRASPLKRMEGRSVTVHATRAGTKRGLNFSGSQRDKVASMQSSSGFGPYGRSAGGTPSASGGGNGAEKNAVPLQPFEVQVSANELAYNMQHMVVDSKLPDLNLSAPHSPGTHVFPKERVSGINSFVESSEDSGSLSLQETGKGASKPSVKERLASASKHGGTDRKGGIKGPGVMKDIDKLRMSKKLVDTNIMMETFRYMQKYDTEAHEAGAPVQQVGPSQLEGSPAKKTKMEAMQTNNLTGAHGEPRQEQ